MSRNTQFNQYSFQSWNEWVDNKTPPLYFTLFLVTKYKEILKSNNNIYIYINILIPTRREISRGCFVIWKFWFTVSAQKPTIFAWVSRGSNQFLWEILRKFPIRLFFSKYLTFQVSLINTQLKLCSLSYSKRIITCKLNIFFRQNFIYQNNTSSLWWIWRIILWIKTSNLLIDGYRRFGVTCYPPIQGWRDKGNNFFWKFWETST